MSTDLPPSANPSAPASAAETSPNTSTTTWQSSILWALLFGIIGGLATWLVIEAFLPMIKIPDSITTRMMSVPDKMVQANNLKREVFTFAVFGGLASLALAVGEGLARKSWKTAVLGGLACGLLGVVLGGSAGYIGHVAHLKLLANSEMSDIVRAMIVQGTMLGLIGAAAGLGIGMFLLRRVGAAVTSLVAGALAAVLAVILYTVIASFFLPNTITDVVIPLKAWERLLWICLTTGMLGLLLAAISSPPKSQTA